MDGLAARLGGYVSGLAGAEDHAAAAEALAEAPGLLQRFDPRIKVVALLALVIAATLTSSLAVLGGLLALAAGLALASRVGLARLALRVWLGVFMFSGVIAAPALVLVPGDALTALPFITTQGVRSAAFLIGRAETAASFAALLMLTTRWPHVLKALASLGVPAAAVAVLGMAHRYIFVLLRAAHELVEARRSRIMGAMDGPARRRLLLSSVGVLLSRTMALGTDIHLAMVARGYRGEVRLLDDFRTRRADWLLLAAALLVPAVIVGSGL